MGTDSENEIRETVRCFIRETIFEHDELPGDTEDLFATGTVDSFGLITLIEFLSKRYSISFAPLELRVENFRSVNAIVATVRSKTNKGSSR